MRILSLLIIVGAVVLAALNPGMSDFEDFAQEQSERLIRQETGDSELGKLLSGVGSHLAGSYIDRITERQNYVLFSTYTVDLDGPEQSEEEWRFLGVADRFVVLEQPASMNEEAGAH